MNLRDYRNSFVVCSLLLSFLAVTPTVGMFVPFYVKESFSELSILGPMHMAKDYPFDIRVNVEKSVFVTVSNHMGRASYYEVYVKFRNLTQSFPNSASASSLAPLYEFRVFLLDGEKWEGLVRFKFVEAARTADSVWVTKMMINNVFFNMNSSSVWNSEYSGFYFQLFFELWLYDETLASFRYYDQFVGIWLNMTI